MVGLVFTTVNGSGHSSQVSYSGTGLVIALPHIFTKERKVAKGPNHPRRREVREQRESPEGVGAHLPRNRSRAGGAHPPEVS